MRYAYLLVALLAFTLPACQTSQIVQPKAKLCVEAPADHPKDVSCKLEVSLN